MKMHRQLIMSVVIVLGSAQAMAEDFEQIILENTPGKIEAVLIDQAEQIELDQNEGRIAAAQINQIENLNRGISKLITIIGEEGDGQALQDNSLGQISDQADLLLKQALRSNSAAEIQNIWSEAMQLKATAQEIATRLQIRNIQF